MFVLLIINECKEAIKQGVFKTEEEAEKEAVSHFFRRISEFYFYRKEQLMYEDEHINEYLINFHILNNWKNRLNFCETLKDFDYEFFNDIVKNHKHFSNLIFYYATDSDDVYDIIEIKDDEIPK